MKTCAAICVLAAILSGCGKGNAAAAREDAAAIVRRQVEAADRREFRSADGRVTLRYPSSWAVRPEMPDVVVALSPEGVRRPGVVMLSVGVQPLGPGSRSVTLAELEKQAVGRAGQGMAPFELLDGADVTLCGQPARRLRYRARREGVDTREVHVFTVVDGSVVTVNYAATAGEYDRHLGAAEQIIGTVRVAGR